MKKTIITFCICFSIWAAAALILYNLNYLFVGLSQYRNHSIGIDVSNHQGTIDWNRIEKKYSFVFIKATEGDDFVDKRFNENRAGAKEAGLLYGAYHFFHFSYDGHSQAGNFIATVGRNIDLPPVIDIEYGGNTKKYEIDDVRREIKIMISEIREYYGVDPIIYVTKESYSALKEDLKNMPIWIRSVIFPLAAPEKDFILWQYSNRARIEGIEGKVDLNVFIWKNNGSPLFF